MLPDFDKNAVFIWACYAIQHAIAMYDQAKTKLGAAA